MGKKFFHGYLSHSLAQVFWGFVLQGVATIALGVIIFLYPEVFTILVSAFFIWLGLMALLFAMKVRAVKQKYHAFFDRF